MKRGWTYSSYLRWKILLPLFAAFLFVLPQKSHAASAEAVVIATGQIDAGISITSLGEVVWSQIAPGSGWTQIYSSVRGQVTNFNISHTNPSINNLGDMVWLELLWDPQQQKPITYIRGNIQGKTVTVGKSEYSITRIDINDRQEVIWAQREASGYSLQSSLRGQLATGPDTFYDPKINNNGDVVFSDYWSGQIFLLPRGTSVPVAVSPVTGQVAIAKNPVILDDGDVVWVESTYSSPQAPSRIVSRNRGVLVDNLTYSIIAMDINVCGDITYLAYPTTGPALYRIGNNSPCVTYPAPNDVQRDAASVTFGSIFTGVVDSDTNPLDWYRFDAIVGESINIVTNFAQTGTDNATAALYDSQGNLVAQTNSPAIHATANMTGTYYLKVESMAGRSSYTVSLSNYTNNCGIGPCPEVIAMGTIGYSTSINTSGEIVWSQLDKTNSVTQIFSSTRGQLTSDAVNHPAVAINNTGDIVWVESSWDSLQSAILYSINGIIGGQSVLLVPCSKTRIVKLDINDRREVVWTQQNSTDSYASAIFSNIRGQLTDFDALFEPSINNRGDVAFYNNRTGQIFILPKESTTPIAVTPTTNQLEKMRTPVILDDGDVVWAEQTESNTFRLVSRNRGELYPLLSMQLESLDVNACGDAAYTSTTLNGRVLYRLGHNAPCESPPPATYPLTARIKETVSGSGSVTSSPAGVSVRSGSAAATVDFASGSDVTLTATAGPDSVFSGWTGACSGMGSCTVTMNASVTVEATFVVRTFHIAASDSPHGTIAGPDTVTYGGSATLKIVPSAGYHIVDVQVDGVSVGAVQTYMFSNINADHSVTAAFNINSYQFTASVTGNGTITGPKTATYGENTVFGIESGSGYHIVDVLVDGISVGAVSNYTFPDVAANHSICAIFGLNTYTITAIPSPNGTISGPSTVTHGDSATFSFTPATGYHIDDVIIDGVSVGPVMRHTFTSVTSGHTVKGLFAINTYTVTATSTTNGTISGPSTVTYGGSVTYTFPPAAGYRIANVQVDGTSVGATSSYTLTNVTSNHTIAATFVALADLKVTTVSAPTKAWTGKAIAATAIITNTGGTNAENFTVAFYLSTDQAVQTGRIPLGTRKISVLNAGAAFVMNENFIVPATMQPGKYYIAALVDAGSTIAEADEANNVKASTGITTIK